MEDGKKTLKITIDGKPIEVPENTKILAAARLLDIYIPTLCYDPRLSPSGRCKLCAVEVKGSARPVYSCLMPVKDGMEVITTSPQLFELRKNTLEKILEDHPNDCMVCEKAGNANRRMTHARRADTLFPGNSEPLQ